MSILDKPITFTPTRVTRRQVLLTLVVEFLGSYVYSKIAIAQPVLKTVPDTLLAPPAAAIPSERIPIPGEDLTDFPDPLQDFGANLTRDKTRLLLGFKTKHTREEIASFLTTSNVPFSLEPSVDPLTGEAHLERKINHTPSRFWVHTKTGSPATQTQVSSLVLTSESIPGYALEWIGPVYRMPGTTRNSGLVCPLPHVIDVTSAPNISDSYLAERLQSVQTNGTTYKLKKVPKVLLPYNTSPTILPGLRSGAPQEFVLEPSNRRPIYALRNFLISQNIASQTRLHYMPLLKPTGGCAGWSGCWVSGADLINSQWNMDTIRASLPVGSSGWNLTKGDETIIVAILDDGCDLQHPDLKCNYFVEPGQTLPGQTYSSGNPPAEGGGITAGDTDSHGTDCVGIFGAGHNNSAGLKGLAGCCKILPLRLDDYTPESIVKAIDHAIATGARVMSMSWGYDPTTFASSFWNDVDEAILRAKNAKIVMCAAAMNADVDRIYYPAKNGNVIACGASACNTMTDMTRLDQRCTLVDWARYMDPDLIGSNKGPELSVVAPGVDILTTGVHQSMSDSLENYIWFAGTSAAAPHVAGLAALILSLKPAFTPDDVRNIIQSTAAKVGTLAGVGGRNNEYGYGRIDVRAALERAQSSSPGGGGSDATPPLPPTGLSIR